jgi:hypothetical protein
MDDVRHPGVRPVSYEPDAEDLISDGKAVLNLPTE